MPSSNISQGADHCTLCGGTQFIPAEDGRLAVSGLPPRCSSCQSLEQERWVRAAFEGIPRGLVEGSKCLRLVLDKALDAHWFSELIEVDSLPALDALPSAHVDWLYAGCPLPGLLTEQLESMLRVVGRGCLVLTDVALSQRHAGVAGGSRDRALGGEGVCEKLASLLPQASVLELAVPDRCSLSLGSVFLVSLEAERLERIAQSQSERNVCSRVLAPTATTLSLLKACLPPQFDGFVYQSLPENADLAKLATTQLRDHFKQFGQHEGRRAHVLASREAFVGVVPPDLDVLEISPGCSPQASGPRTRYFALHDTQGGFAWAERFGLPTSRVPEIHYVSATGDLGVIDDKFDVVISSHVIEHQPDLVGHLQAVERLLRPGGLYFVLAPDQRYCFDHYMQLSSIADVLEAHCSGRKRHTILSHLAHCVYWAHNQPARHWRGDHGAPRDELGMIGLFMKEHEQAGSNYVDMHAWYFQPDSFRRILRAVRDAGLTGFDVLRLYPSLLDTCEFWAVLAKDEAKA